MSTALLWKVDSVPLMESGKGWVDRSAVMSVVKWFRVSERVVGGGVCGGEIEAVLREGGV